MTFHGGAEPHDWNNIHAFDAAGKPLGKALDIDGAPHGVALRELRGFAFGPDGDLYAANAYQDRSQILRFAGTPDRHGRHPFREVFVARHDGNRGLSHPFHVLFGPDGHLYVPSQDTDVVSRYAGPTATEAKPGSPLPLPPALRPYAGDLHPGTFVPSARNVPGGLRAVRHALFGPDGALYVADRAADRVVRYDAVTGERQRDYAAPALAAPVHLLARPGDGRLLVGSRDRHAVVALDPATGEVAPLVAPGAGGLAKPGGLAVGPDGLLYVASRTGRAVLRFDPQTGEPAGSFLTDLPDEPEFVAWVPGPA